MAYHAELSPSGADRWMQCPGSVALSAGLPDEGSSYADEGTAAHFLAAWCLTTGKNPEDRRGESITVGTDGESAFYVKAHPEHEALDTTVWPVNDDMVSHVGRYLHAVRQQAEGGVLLVEQKVPISAFTGEDGATGSADAIVITRDGELQVHDLKYGAGKPVSAFENRQLKLYALGALEELGLAYDFTHARLFIHQPRVGDGNASEWDLSLDALAVFGEEVKSSAFDARCAKEAAATDAEAGWGETYLNPGESQCRWCRAKATCPSLADFVAQAVGAGFEDLDALGATVAMVSLEEAAPLSQKMAAAPLIEQWLKAVRAAVESTLLAGGPVPGYKLVRGRAGNRQWGDPGEAETMLKAMRLKVEEMYDLKLISPTTAEKLSKPGADGKAVIGPRQWKKVQESIVRPEGGLSVAPESDKREAVNPAAKADDFDDLGDDLV